MSGTTIHKRARTTPQLREEIQNSSLSERALAEKYNVSRSTVRKWKYRETASDRSHRPHRLHTALTPAQEAIVVELRRSLLLATDDLLVVTREFIKPDMVRSALQRLLVRHGVSNRKDLIPQPEGEAKPKTFKDYQPGYVHVDIKYLPAMADEDRRTYLFVAIDRASRWVYLERHKEKSQKAAVRFLKHLREKAPFHLRTLLTDNDLAFTDRFTQKDRQPTGQHAFDRLCTRFGIDHRLTPPRRPQTNGLVERFNGRIAEILRTTHFESGADLDSMLWHYNRLYNHHIPQRALGHTTPVQKLKDWYAKSPDLFQKQVYDQSGLDTYETLVDFDVQDDANLALDVDLPEIEDLPTQEASVGARGDKLNLKSLAQKRHRLLYLSLIHGIGLRLLGECFRTLPTIHTVTLSAYSQRIDSSTGHEHDDYLYSAIVTREAFADINFANLEAVDPVSTLERFDLRRNMTKTGIIKPVEPF